jgi:drug/metabolite transporter (DMT)-like permease
MFHCTPLSTVSDSSHLVTVPFHQIIRSTTPLFVIILSILLYSKSFPLQTYLSLVPVTIGVALATAGDYYFTPVGFLLTLFGTLLAAIKTILTNRIQKRSGAPQLHPLDLLLRMSPLACIQSLVYASSLDEPRKLHSLFLGLGSRQRLLLAVKLAMNGLLAFGLNYVSFAANRKTSPLTMTVAANVKQCLSILLGVWVFKLHVGWMNALGICITLIGGAWYARVELGVKIARVKLLEGDVKEIV